MSDITSSPEEPPQQTAAGIALSRSSSLTLILDTPKGRGIFASKAIPAHTILEVCPVLVLDPAENETHIRKTELYHYTYNWPYTPKTQSSCEGTNGASKPPTTSQAVILGLGSMFNHSTLHQNVGWKRDVKNLLVTYTALRDIKEGEELCISYGSRLTFKDTEEDALNEVEDENEIFSKIELID
ncbi:f9f9a738-fd71-4e55-ba28-9b6bc6a97c9b [Sclerotinia trifoliorum]|uniref:F9f9a738-fd71-4e55-ba28-9b6bc6a97c9b n=1 Tax=Sclerotinia trifoliorum TaxID=28548 RepID=A0A8H2W370_9HELO|nr:f9f9a738-fd71-4e55-ba28-9b6bc6a97c9b [Sclerotinia trifoliorum]